MSENIDTLVDHFTIGVPPAMIASLGNPQYLIDGTDALGEVYTHLVGELNIGTSNARYSACFSTCYFSTSLPLFQHFEFPS